MFSIAVATVVVLLVAPLRVESGCSFCTDGGTMGYPQHAFPDTELTCLEYEENVMSKIAPEDCQSTKDELVEGSAIDLFAFCGCDGVPAPNLCSFCGGSIGVFSRATPFGEGIDGNTCAGLALISPFVIDFEFCDSTIQLFEGFCCGNFLDLDDDDDFPCSICPGSSPVGNPFREVAFFDGQTCASVEKDLSLIPKEFCAEIRHELVEVLDLSAWCGCEGVDAPQTCSFCAEGENLIDPTYEIPGSNGMTCEDAEEFAPFVTSNGVCEEDFGRLARGCCTTAEDRCSICSDGASMGLPNRPFMFGEGGGTCGAVDFTLGFLSPDECGPFHDSTPIDTASWCGCEGAFPPSKCNMCGEDSIGFNEDMEIPDSGGFTCGEIAELARHVVDDDFCEAHVSLLAGECCSVPPPPTDAPIFVLNLPKMTAVSAAAQQHHSHVVVSVLVVAGWVWMW